MKLVKFYQENGLIPTKANPSDSGFDVKSNGLTMVVNSDQGFNREYILLTPKEFHEMDETTQHALIRTRLGSAFEKMHSQTLYSAYMRYNTGLRVILPQNSDIKGRCKSGRSGKAPLLGTLQNAVGIIDEHYRGEILFIYELQPMILYHLDYIADQSGLISDVMKGIYLPSSEKSIGQITIEHREDIEVEVISTWIPEYENTDRGTGGHDSTKS